jgi:acetyltransferase
MPDPLDAIFKPKNIAVIGASTKRGSLGHKVINNLITFGFEGIIYPVNQKSPYVHSLKSYKSVLDIPESVDLAIVLVPKEYVPGVVDECGKKGVKGIIVISAGFREIGGEGVKREEQLVKKITEYGMRMIGPNCMGVFNTAPEVRINATFAPTEPHDGNIAFISQSGALGAVVLELANHLQLGISMFASMGNKADISGNDLLEYYYKDPCTKIILMYLENLGNPRRFFEIARRITPEKPIIVVKAGKTQAGAMAASSHTGALADSEVAIEALMQQAGVMRVSTIEEMFTLAMAFAHQPIPKGDRVAVLTNAGGPGILATDSVISQGLTLAKFTDETKEKLRGILPQEASVTNPVDMISTADQESYRAALEIILNDENVDSMIVIFVTPVLVKSIDVAYKIAEVISRHPNKTITTCLMGHEGVLSGVEELEKQKIPVYRFPETAVRALTAMKEYREFRQKKKGQIRTFEVDKKTVAAIIKKVQEENRSMLTSDEVRDVLKAYGFPLAECATVQNAESAIQFALQVNRPVVLKLLSKDITHKSDVGGVKVDLRMEQEIREAFREILKNVEKRFPSAQIDGFIVQEMVKDGKETVLGMNFDPKCGPVIMFGLGGIYVEVLRDVSFRIAPLTDVDALEMINSLRNSPLLKGVRGEKPVNIGFIIENLQRLSQLSMDFEAFKELDINPFIVTEKPKQCKIVDARIMIKM